MVPLVEVGDLAGGIQPVARRRRAFGVVLLSVLAVCAVCATLALTQPGGHRSAGKLVDPSPSQAYVQPIVTAVATTEPPPEPITSCTTVDTQVEAGYQSWYTTMNAAGSSFADKASATSLLASNANDARNFDQAMTGNPNAPGVVDSILLENALIPLEDDLPLNQTGAYSLPPNYHTSLEAAYVSAVPFAQC